MLRHAVSLTAALVLAAPAVAAASSSAGPGCNASWPVVAYRAGGELVALPASAARPVACGVPTGFASSESSIAVTGNGTLIYSPAETENSMARSTDGGATWTLTYPANEQPTSFWNTVDPYVIADRRTGRVFWTHATGPVRNEGGLPQGSGFYLAAAYGFQAFASSDDGFSWGTADYSTAPTGDWEKLSVGPAPPASTGVAQPTGYRDIVYLCANSPFEVTGPGRLCYKSLDGGKTFNPVGYMSPTPSNPPDVCPPLNFNPGVIDSRGTFYTPADCQGAAYAVITRDEGATYSWEPIPGAPTSGAAGGPQVSLAVDESDVLYALWLASGKLYLAISRDQAKSWSRPMEITAPGVHSIDHPTLAAGATGHLGITYYGTPDPSAKMLNAYITQTDDALDPQPLFYSGAINDPAHPIYHDYGLTGGSPRVDFIGGAFDAAGTSFWSGVVKQFGPPDSSGNIATTGYVGRLVFSSATPARTGPRFSCGRPSGRLAGTTLGPVRLGMTRAGVRLRFSSFSTRGYRYMDFFCPARRGIRVGYASPRLLARLSARERAGIRGRAVLILTANFKYRLRGVRPGVRLASVARKLGAGGGFHIGLNWWYLSPNGASRGVLKVRHGVIEEIGIADLRLTDTRQAALRFLRSFD